MAREIWLRKNHRPFVALAILPGIVLVLAAAMLAMAATPTIRWIAGIFFGLALALLAWLAWQSRRPRLALNGSFLEVFLAGRKPIEVPVQIVECFFLGQGPSLLPKIDQASSPETATLIVRLAESAADWKHRDVRPTLGQWCEGYITIRGTYSEPLRPELALHLNRRLVEAHRSLKQK